MNLVLCKPSLVNYKTQLHAKTGSLSDTKAYSGYFYARNGHVYAISFLANGISRGDAGKTELQTFKQFLLIVWSL